MIATIGTLTALLLPVLSKAKARAMQASCSANLRQLGYAWQMYAIDNGGRLVESYPNNDNPNVWVKGDMTKPTEATNTSLLEAGKLYSYHKAVSIYHCPTDRGTLIEGERIQTVRSYSMNSFMGARDPSLAPIPSTASKFVPFFAKDSDIALHRPSELFVLIDEDEKSINDGFFVTDPNARIWFDFPSIASYRHQFTYTLNFADGHAQLWKLHDRRTRDVFRGPTEQFGNTDLQRLARVATVPK